MQNLDEFQPEVPQGPAEWPDPVVNLEGPPPVRASLVVALAVAAGLLAGVVSWGLGELAINVFRPPLRRIEAMGQVMMKATYADQASADYKNAILSYALSGASLGLFLGLASGLARHSARVGVITGAAGLLLGGLLAGGGSAFLLTFYFRAAAEPNEGLSQDLLTPLLALGGSWAAAGLGGGIALGLGLGRSRAGLIKAGIGGLLGGLLAGVLYLVGGAVVFPSYKISMPLPSEWPARLAGTLLAATFAGLMSGCFAAQHVPPIGRNGP